MTHHDNSYKLLFSHPRMVRDLLTGFVKEAWVEQLDFTSLEKVSGSYVTDELRDRENDIIWRIRWGKNWLYVYLLLEFQSSVDRFMAVRIMSYVGLLYQHAMWSPPSSGWRTTVTSRKCSTSWASWSTGSRHPSRRARTRPSWNEYGACCSPSGHAEITFGGRGTVGGHQHIDIAATPCRITGGGAEQGQPGHAETGLQLRLAAA